MKDVEQKSGYESGASRRRFVKLAASGVMLIPIVSLGGCSDDKATTAPTASPAAAPTPEPRQPAAAPTPVAQPSAAAKPAASAPAPALVKLDEADPVASSLGYRENAADVDTSQFEKYSPGQNCANCTLYQADASTEAGWGACSIYPGKLVNAEGWCNVYAAKT